jgi:hypothetical protein
MEFRVDKKYLEALPVVIAMVLAAVVWGVIRYYSVVAPINSLGDWSAHLSLAEEMHLSGNVVSPHFLFQLLVIFVVEFTGVGYSLAGLIVDLFSNILLTLLLYKFYLAFTNSPTALQRVLSAFASFATAFLVPIVFSENMANGDLLRTYLHYYRGSFHFANVYHNPTVLLLRPFALGLFWVLFIVQALNENISRTRFLGYLVLAITLVVCNAIAKPSFLIVILPAAGIIWLRALYLRNWVAAKLLLFGVLVPSVVILLTQYGLSYYLQVGRMKVSMGLSPFLMMQHVFGTLGVGMIALFGAILFPLMVMVFFWKKSLSSPHLLTALASTVVAFMWAILLAEFQDGELHDAGNFFWCIQISLFILFVSTIRIVLEELSTRYFTREVLVIAFIPILALCGHLYMGVAWYAHTLNYVLTRP